MLSKLFNLLFGVPGKTVGKPECTFDAHPVAATFHEPKVLALPPSYPSRWVSQKSSIELIEACRIGDLSRVEKMLKADPSLVNATEYMPAGKVKGSQTFHSGDGIDAMTAVQASVFYGHNEILKLLISKGAGVSYGPISTAAEAGNLEALQTMLPVYKAWVEQKESNSDNSMAEALVLACRGGHRAAANFLLDSGASINGAGGFYRTGSPLKAAMRSSSPDLVKDLLDRGANVNAHDVRCCETYRDTNQEALAMVRAVRLQQGGTPTSTPPKHQMGPS